jgi:hypothetical protein
LPGRETFVSEQGGFSIDYPGAWGCVDEEGLLLLTSESLESTDEGALVLVIFGPLDDPDIDLWEWWAEAEEEWLASGDVVIGEPEPVILDGEDALAATIEDDESYGFFIVTISHDYAYVFLVIATPVDAWGDYEDVLVVMLESVQFFPPE